LLQGSVIFAFERMLFDEQSCGDASESKRDISRRTVEKYPMNDSRIQPDQSSQNMKHRSETLNVTFDDLLFLIVRKLEEIHSDS